MAPKADFGTFSVVNWAKAVKSAKIWGSPVDRFGQHEIAPGVSKVCQTSIQSNPHDLNFSTFQKIFAVEISIGNTRNPDDLCEKAFEIWVLWELRGPGNFRSARNFYENFIFW